MAETMHPEGSACQEGSSGSKKGPRLQVLMEHRGIASRRHSADFILAGEVWVDGQQIWEPGYRVPNPEQAVIEVDGQVFGPECGHSQHRTIVLNKPAGLICSSSDCQGETVFACLSGVKERLVCVGRLDQNSEGLLILSNDGELVNRLTHPRYGHRKVYYVGVTGCFDERVLKFLNSSMLLDGYRIRPAEVDYVERQGNRHVLRFVLSEGRNRQIRKMCELAGLRVRMLIRTAINGFELPPELRPGEWRDLSPTELKQLDPSGSRQDGRTARDAW